MAGEILKVTGGNASGRSIPLEQDFVIGRGESEEGRLQDDPEISRQHARVSRTPQGELLIEDLGSMNGTFVNGERIQSPRVLKPGDTVKVGQSVLQVESPGGRAPHPTVYGGRSPETRPGDRPPVVATPRESRTDLRRVALFALPVLLVGAIIAAVVILASGGDDEPKKAAATTPLTGRELIERGSKSTLQVIVRKPEVIPELRDKIAIPSWGTGFVVDAQEGRLMTNAHVVAGATSVKVRLPDRSEVPARVEGQAPCEDLAVISMNPTPEGLTEARLGDSGALRAGDEVTALGFPRAFAPGGDPEKATEERLQATQGSVTAPPASASLGELLPELPSVIQHQAPINGGNSGGPLFNDRGQVVGINTVSVVSQGSEGQHGSIAIDRAKSLLPALEQNKNTSYMGWDLYPMSVLAAEIPGLSGINGLVVFGVDAGSPADKARLRTGERAQIDLRDSPLLYATIFEVNGQPVRDISDVCDVLSSKRSGDTISVLADALNFPPRKSQAISFEMKL